MAAPYHPQGYLSRALQYVRVMAQEPALDEKYTDTDLVPLFRAALEQVLQDVYSNAVTPPLGRFTLSVTANQATYKLPAICQEVHRISSIASESGLARWEVIPRSKYSSAGAGVLFDGSQDIRFVPTPTVTEDYQVEYVPGGNIALHQNVCALGTGPASSSLMTSTTIRLSHATNSGWFLGEFDRRPNAYTGMRLRLLGTVNDLVPGALTTPWMPIQERMISSYNLYSSATATVDPQFDSSLLSSSTWANWVGVDPITLPHNPGVTTTYFVYEIVPDLDPAIMWLAAIETAIQLVTIERRLDKIPVLTKMFQDKLRAARLRWANFQMRSPGGFETDTVDRHDLEDWWP